MEYSFVHKLSSQACFTSAFNIKNMCSGVFVGNAKVNVFILFYDSEIEAISESEAISQASKAGIE